MLIVLLIQSCVAYQYTSVPLSDAYDKGNVMVISQEDKKYWFKKIDLIDSIYYGFYEKKTGDEWVDIAIPLSDDKVTVYLKDKKNSNWRTAVFIISSSSIVIGVGLIIWAVFAAPISYY